jgi:hypothetical protein
MAAIFGERTILERHGTPNGCRIYAIQRLQADGMDRPIGGDRLPATFVTVARVAARAVAPS